jgi:hypothetical protein
MALTDYQLSHGVLVASVNMGQPSNGESAEKVIPARQFLAIGCYAMFGE